ncbi:MAG: trimethylamine methyltransferase family protein [Promethearchaeota archaeon]
MGILRPGVKVLDDEHQKEILKEAKGILQSQGIFLENADAIKLFTEKGIDVRDNRAFIPEDVIDKALSTVPHEISLYDREGNFSFTLKDNQVHFDPGSAAIYVLDEHTGEIREATKEDFIRFSQVVDRLPHIDAQSTAIVYQDVPSASQDWHRLYIALSNCHKPVITGTFRKESFSIMKELLLACRNSEQDLADKPLAIFDACPSPPLMWSDLTTQSLIDCAQSMIPSEFVSMPLAGATAPITLLGCITQHTAECLAGVVIGQIAKPGAPLIWGGSPAVFDMKYGTTPMGAIETMMINLGDNEMGKFLRLPTHAYMALSDSKIPDGQAGFESGMGAILAGMGGINMVSGPGMLDFESVQSIEKLVMDNEICGMVKFFLNGLQDRGKPYAADILAEYNPKQSLLAHPSTRKYFRSELFLPTPVIERRTRDLWKKNGSQSIRKRGLTYAENLLAKPSKFPISKDLQQRLTAIAEENLL